MTERSKRFQTLRAIGSAVLSRPTDAEGPTPTAEQLRSPPPRSARRSGRKWVAFLMLGVGLAIIGAIAIVDRGTAPPWARAHDGHPALTGYWQGRMTFAHGDDRLIVFRLLRFTGARGGNGKANLTGEAMLCGSTGTARATLYGAALDPQSSRLTIGFSWKKPFVPGLFPEGIEGSWDGRDLIGGSSELGRRAPDGATSMGSDDPVIHYELHRSTSSNFNSGC